MSYTATIYEFNRETNLYDQTIIGIYENKITAFQCVAIILCNLELIEIPTGETMVNGCFDANEYTANNFTSMLMVNATSDAKLIQICETYGDCYYNEKNGWYWTVIGN